MQSVLAFVPFFCFVFGFFFLCYFYNVILKPLFTHSFPVTHVKFPLMCQIQVMHYTTITHNSMCILLFSVNLYLLLLNNFVTINNVRIEDSRDSELLWNNEKRLMGKTVLFNNLQLPPTLKLLTYSLFFFLYVKKIAYTKTPDNWTWCTFCVWTCMLKPKRIVKPVRAFYVTSIHKQRTIWSQIDPLQNSTHHLTAQIHPSSIYTIYPVLG